MKIGIPKGLAIYEYPVLFDTFFKELGVEVVYSTDTNNEIFKNGINLSIDENCLASKVYLGHIYNLVSRIEKENIDYIFVPRICSFKKRETVCVKFYAMYDICKNMFDAKFLTINVDYEKGETMLKSFIRIGKKLNKKTIDIVRAYKVAKSSQEEHLKKKLKEEKLRINNENNLPNILVVSHPYVIYDKKLGKPVYEYLNKLGTNIFFSDVNDTSNLENYKKISKSLYWKFNKNLLSGIIDYIDKMDGIIYLSTFPCGPDSLVTEITMRKIKDIPSINIIIDEQDANAGMYTRLESFVDILQTRKALNKRGA